MSEIGSAHEHGSRHVHYIDSRGEQHDALILGHEDDVPDPSLNAPVDLVCVDRAGAKIEHLSVPHRDAAQGAHHTYHHTNETHHHMITEIVPLGEPGSKAAA